MSTTVVRWGLKTDVGMVRRANQDAVMANGSLFVVADGMGGHRGGEVASGITVGHFVSIGKVDTVEELQQAVIDANDMIVARGEFDPDLGGMGTTVVAIGILPIDEPGAPLQICAANVGDSRLYVLEDSTLTQVSVDHSLVDELVRAGQISATEALIHPQRNVVTRALGAESRVNVDTWVLPSHSGQRWLLCSDGLINEVPHGDVQEVLLTIDDPEAAANRLVDLANASGGRDNITVLIVDIDPDV